MTTNNNDLLQAIDRALDERSLTWAAQWIEDSLTGETNERVVEFGKNMAMTLRAAAPPSTTPSARVAAEEIVRLYDLEKPGWVTLGRIMIDRQTETEKFERTSETATDRIEAIITKHCFPVQPVEPICWHCGVVLAYAPKLRCENCADECDVEGCDEMGCAPSAQPVEEHRLASISGALEDHPLRDEYAATIGAATADNDDEVSESVDSAVNFIKQYERGSVGEEGK